jgi:hypothetical protein
VGHGTDFAKGISALTYADFRGIALKQRATKNIGYEIEYAGAYRNVVESSPVHTSSSTALTCIWRGDWIKLV